MGPNWRAAGWVFAVMGAAVLGAAVLAAVLFGLLYGWHAVLGSWVASYVATAAVFLGGLFVVVALAESDL